MHQTQRFPITVRSNKKPPRAEFGATIPSGAGASSVGLYIVVFVSQIWGHFFFLVAAADSLHLKVPPASHSLQISLALL